MENSSISLNISSKPSSLPFWSLAGDLGFLGDDEVMGEVAGGFSLLCLQMDGDIKLGTKIGLDESDPDDFGEDFSLWSEDADEIGAMMGPNPGGSLGFSASFLEGLRLEIDPVKGASALKRLSGDLDSIDESARPSFSIFRQGLRSPPGTSPASLRHSFRTVSISTEGISTWSPM